MSDALQDLEGKLLHVHFAWGYLEWEPSAYHQHQVFVNGVLTYCRSLFLRDLTLSGFNQTQESMLMLSQGAVQEALQSIGTTLDEQKMIKPWLLVRNDAVSFGSLTNADY